MKKISKEALKEKRNALNRVISNRILILAFAILSVFGIILGRLIYLQAISHDEYMAKQDDYTSIRQYTQPPRGQIYDRNGNVLAKTVVSHNIVYTAPNNLSSEDYLLYADRVNTVFDVSSEDFSDQDLKEAYITYTRFLDQSDPKYQGLDLLTEKELEDYKSGAWGSNTNAKLYSIQMKAITDDILKEVDEKELRTYAIYNRMMANASTGQESTILEDVADPDVAYLVEHKTEFPGFDVNFGGWKREYPYGESLSDVLGTVSTSTEGLPDSSSDYYRSKGYQFNAQVGKSGLEYQYNDILAGTEEIAKITYDSNGLAHKEIIQEARKGNDIYLSIDIDVQTKMDETVKTVLEQNAGTTNRENFYSLYMNMMDPNTGDMIALSGYQMDPETRQMTYFASGNYLTLANPGSCVKGATVYMGESEGVMQPGEYINDTVMNIGGEEFGSFSNHGVVNDIQALSVSSNVYMFHIAIRLGGDTYKEGEPLNIPNVTGSLDLMRHYYSMFGLGNETGLDVPEETPAYIGVNDSPGMLLNYAIGQFDMYSPMQMLQYVSTIAADGKMYKPHLMTHAMEVNSDQVFDVQEPQLKNTLPEENQAILDRVQEGFKACVDDGNCFEGLQNQPYSMAAKTGTAEVEEWTTANIVGYGPYEDPSVAFACIAPTSSVNNQSVSPNICATQVVGPVLQTYFEKYPQEDAAQQ
ncbi:penicillin-binding transpeptidase domain-containing protein [Ileibacterium valens]|uniref:penicillin-binding transpeptidase domain-containing protein n=1 Tax=Ileibacterium valens TaxID=1862668 RepID=UPI000B1C24EA|nr:penicillin-binding transpeptidase domain-containing protein [Ileibacterium valens]